MFSTVDLPLVRISFSLFGLFPLGLQKRDQSLHCHRQRCRFYRCVADAEVSRRRKVAVPPRCQQQPFLVKQGLPQRPLPCKGVLVKILAQIYAEKHRPLRRRVRDACHLYRALQQRIPSLEAAAVLLEVVVDEGGVGEQAGQGVLDEVRASCEGADVAQRLVQVFVTGVHPSDAHAAHAEVLRQAEHGVQQVPCSVLTHARGFGSRAHQPRGTHKLHRLAFVHRPSVDLVGHYVYSALECPHHHLQHLPLVVDSSRGVVRIREKNGGRFVPLLLRCQVGGLERGNK
mmetsp:Transcript_317/g.546  ORF Transcript_317/g.546 Transcript_317/m.546 type:complete len:286 (+) Transcript_317:262-1119(+)